MRFVSIRKVRLIAQDELGMTSSMFAKKFGISFDELYARASASDSSIAHVELSIAKAIDTEFGRCVSFVAPLSSELVDLHDPPVAISRIREFMARSGVSATTMAQLVGGTREWVHRTVAQPDPWMKKSRLLPIVDQLLRSNESPNYDLPTAVGAVEDAHRMPPVLRRCAIPMSSSMLQLPCLKAQKWRKILDVLVRMSEDGLRSVCESELIVAMWQHWPMDFGLKHYETFYPEAREVRSKLVSAPLKNFVERDLSRQQHWTVNSAGVHLVRRQRANAKKALYSKPVLLVVNRADGGKRCRQPGQPRAYLPSLQQVQTATAAMKSKLFAPFIESSRKPPA